MTWINEIPYLHDAIIAAVLTLSKYLSAYYWNGK